MIGRAAQGRPWIFVKYPLLKTGEHLAAPNIEEVKEVLLGICLSYISFMVNTPVVVLPVSILLGTPKVYAQVMSFDKICIKLKRLLNKL